MVIQYVAQLVIGVRRSQVELVSGENDGHLFVDGADLGHPVRLQSFDAIEVVDIIHQHDDVGSFDLRIGVLLLIFVRAGIYQLRIYAVVGEDIVIWCHRHRVIHLLGLPREVVGYQCFNY